MQSSLRNRAAQALALLADKDRDAAALRQINLRFDTALNNMTHGLLMCDAAARVIVVNRRFCEIFQIPTDCIDRYLGYRDLLALSVAAGNHPGRTIDDLLAEQSLAPGSREGKTVTQSIAGDRTVAMSFEPMPEGGWIAACEDITERRKAEDQVAFLAHHDALTALPNRMLFQQRLDQALVAAGSGKTFALHCLDLDRFKSVNDTLGHPVGDSLLVAVASRLRGVVRERDTVARMGGGEFAVLQIDRDLAGRNDRARRPDHPHGQRALSPGGPSDRDRRQRRHRAGAGGRDPPRLAVEERRHRAVSRQASRPRHPLPVRTGDGYRHPGAPPAGTRPARRAGRGRVGIALPAAGKQPHPARDRVRGAAALASSDARTGRGR